MTDWAILDTSWLLELYQVPRHSQKDRYEEVLGQAREAAQGWMLVTVPVLFEFANTSYKSATGIFVVALSRNTANT